MPASHINDIPVPATNLVNTKGTIIFSSPMTSADYVLNVGNNGYAGAPA